MYLPTTVGHRLCTSFGLVVRWLRVGARRSGLGLPARAPQFRYRGYAGRWGCVMVDVG